MSVNTYRECTNLHVRAAATRPLPPGPPVGATLASPLCPGQLAPWPCWWCRWPAGRGQHDAARPNRFQQWMRPARARCWWPARTARQGGRHAPCRDARRGPHWNAAPAPSPVPRTRARRSSWPGYPPCHRVRRRPPAGQHRQQGRWCGCGARSSGRTGAPDTARTVHGGHQQHPAGRGSPQRGGHNRLCGTHPQ